MKHRRHSLVVAVAALASVFLGCENEPASQEVPISKVSSSRSPVDRDAASKPSRNIPTH